MDNEARQAELVRVLQDALAHGARQAWVSKDEQYRYGYVIMPKMLVLCVQDGSWGWEITYPYVPSRKCGSGCQVLAELPVVTWALLEQAAQEGPTLAHKYGATQYPFGGEWLSKTWSFTAGRMQGVTNNG